MKSRVLLGQLRRSRYAADIGKVVSSATLSQLLFIACTPVLTRLYSPEDFGVLAVFVSILGLVPVLANFRYDVAISLSSTKQESFHILAFCLIGSVFCSGVVAVVFGSGLLAGTDSNLSQIQPFWWLLAIGTLAVGIFAALYAWAGYAQEFGLVAKVQVKQAVSAVVTQLGLGVLLAGPVGLLVGYIVSQSYGATSFAREVRRQRPEKFGFVDVVAVAKKYRRFFYFAFPAGLINRLGIYAVPVLFGYFYALSTAGFYLLAQRLVALPMLVIGRSVAQVYTNRLAKDLLREQTRLLPTYLRTVLALFLVGLLPMALLLAFAPWLFSFVFGADWRVAGTFCQLLVPAFYAQFVVSPMIQTLNVLGHQVTQLVWDCLRLVSIIAVFVVSDAFGYSEMSAVVAISGALCAMYVLQFLLSLWAIRRYDRRIED